MSRGGKREGSGRKCLMWKTVFMRVPEPLQQEFKDRILAFKKEEAQKRSLQESQ